MLASFFSASLAAVTAIVILAATPTAVQQPPVDSQTATGAGSCASERSVQASGLAIVEVVPDQSLINLGIQGSGNTPEQAQSQVAATGQAIIKALRAMGVEEKKITTSYYYIAPVYDNYETMRIKSFNAQYALGVTINDARKVSDVVTTAFKSGATSTHGVEFRSSELRKHRDEARNAAVKAAAEKAQGLANAAGAKVGCVLKIEEVRADTMNPWNPWWGRPNQSQNVVINQGGPAPGDLSDAPISLGTISVRAEVIVTYSLQDN